jgi:succinoglycan biosynthesis transport protein ExoP
MIERPDVVSNQSSSPGFQDYLHILRRRRAIIIQSFLLVLVAGTVLTGLQSPVYRAVSRLLVTPPSYVINSVSTDPISSLFMQPSNYSPATQVEMLQRADIRSKVAQRLGLKALPQVKVEVLEGTSIIQVAVEGENRVVVADTANAFVDIYTQDVKETATGALRNALKFASDQEESSRKRAELNFDRLSRLKKKNSLPDIENTRQSQQEIVRSLALSYNTSRAQLDEARRRIAFSEAKLTSLSKTRSDVPTWQADPSIQQLQIRIDDLDTELRALGEDLGANNQVVVSKNRLVQDLRRRMAEYKRNFADRTQRLNPVWQTLSDQIIQQEIEAAALATRAANLSSSLAEATKRLEQIPSLERLYIQYDSEWKAGIERAKYWGDRKRDIELRLQTAGQNQAVRDIEKAAVPVLPIRPNRQQNIGLAALFGLFVGLALALVLELVDDRINSPEDAERTFGLPTLGLIPLVEEEGLRLIRDIATFSPLMESYRTLRTNVNFAAVGAPMRSLLVTSSVPAEGKSTTVANLAMSFAMDGKRVIVVDADLRRPSQHKLFRETLSPGLTDLLLDTHSIEDVVRSTGVDRVSLITAGSPPPNPAELLGSGAMKRVIADLGARADIVIFDSPPSLAVADSVVLATLMDGVAVVVGFGETKRSSTRRAIDILRRANTRVFGTVLNRLSSSAGGYYYYYYYSGKYYAPVEIESTAPGTPVSAVPEGDTGSGADSALPVGRGDRGKEGDA